LRKYNKYYNKKHIARLSPVGVIGGAARALTGRAARPGGYRRAEAERRAAFMRRVAVRVCAGLITLLVIAAVNRLILHPKAAVSFPLSDVEAFEIPIGTLEQLRTLSDQHGMDFAQTLTVYSFENGFFPVNTASSYQYGGPGELERVFIGNYDSIRAKYPKSAIDRYSAILGAVIGEMRFFPIPANFDGGGADDDNFMYGDSWRVRRTGEFKDETPGTDIYDREDAPGRIPIVSVCAGTVKEKKWGNVSGYEIKIAAASGNVYTYSHLDSFRQAPDAGQRVTAGQQLGMMGDTGLGREGTKGNMQTHLHFSIQPAANKARVTAINPYPFLRLCESRKSDYQAASASANPENPENAPIPPN